MRGLRARTRNPRCNNASPAITGFDVAVTISVIRPPSVASSPLAEHHLDGLQPGRLGDGLAAGGRAESFGNQAAKKPFIPNDVGQAQGVCAGRRILAVAAQGAAEGKKAPPKRQTFGRGVVWSGSSRLPGGAAARQRDSCTPSRVRALRMPSSRSSSESRRSARARESCSVPTIMA